MSHSPPRLKLPPHRCGVARLRACAVLRLRRNTPQRASRPGATPSIVRVVRFSCQLRNDVIAVWCVAVPCGAARCQALSCAYSMLTYAAWCGILRHTAVYCAQRSAAPPKACIPRRRHRLPREDLRENVGVGVGAVECELNTATHPVWTIQTWVRAARCVVYAAVYHGMPRDITTYAQVVKFECDVRNGVTTTRWFIITGTLLLGHICG